jgi:protein-tyrosine phosphatase
LCYGNICRSPFAARYWNQKVSERGRSTPQAGSAGFHEEVGRQTPSRFLPLVKELGVDLSDHRSALVTGEMLQAADAVFVMDEKNYRAVLEQFPEALSKTQRLAQFSADPEVDIRDPWPLETPEAQQSYRHLTHALDGLLRTLLPA